jgi:hypothetical protein
VWLFFQDGWEQRFEKGARWPLASIKLALRERQEGAQPHGSDPDVAFSRSDVGAGDSAVVELAPKAPLKPYRWYEVLLLTATGEQRLSEFAVGPTQEEVFHTWNGVGGPRFVRTPARALRTCNRCPDKPWVELDLDGTVPPLLFAIWLEGPDGSLDLERPPVTYLRPKQRRDRKRNDRVTGSYLVIGQDDACLGHPLSLPLPENRDRLKIAIQAVDQTGKRSTPEQVSVRLRNPQDAW